MSDTMEGWLIATGFLGAGIWMIWMGVRGKQGYDKSQFVSRVSLRIPKSGIYATIPMGIAFLGMSIGAFIILMSDNTDLGGKVIAVCGGLGLLIGFIFMAWKPTWLKPDWLLWLKATYNQDTLAYILSRATQEAWGEEARAWNEQLATQAGLEAWAEERAAEYRALLEQERSAWD